MCARHIPARVISERPPRRSNMFKTGTWRQGDEAGAGWTEQFAGAGRLLRKGYASNDGQGLSLRGPIRTRGREPEDRTNPPAR